MKVLNDIEKQFYNTIQFMKSTASETIQKLINSGEIDFTKNPKEVTTKIVAAINLSIEQGYLQSSRNLKKSMEKLIKDEIKNQVEEVEAKVKEVKPFFGKQKNK